MSEDIINNSYPFNVFMKELSIFILCFAQIFSSSVFSLHMGYLHYFLYGFGSYKCINVISLSRIIILGLVEIQSLSLINATS